MPKRMPRTTTPLNARLPAHDLKISFRVPHRHGRSRPRGKDARMVVLPEIPVQALSQLNAHWYESLFVALSLNAKHEVVEVHILARQAEHLAYPESAVKGDEPHSMRAGLITADGLPVHKRLDVLRAKRR